METAADDTDRRAAAVKLQAVSRGRSSRQLNSALPAADSESAPLSSALADASQLSRDSEEARQAAAIKLQATSRGRSCRNVCAGTSTRQMEPGGGSSSAVAAGTESELWKGMDNSLYRQSHRQSRRVSFGMPDDAPSAAVPQEGIAEGAVCKEATSPATPPWDETPAGRVRLPQKGGFVIRTPRSRKAILGEEPSKKAVEGGGSGEAASEAGPSEAATPIGMVGGGAGVGCASMITFKDASATKKELEEKEAEAARETQQGQATGSRGPSPPLPPDAGGMRPSRRRSACTA